MVDKSKLAMGIVALAISIGLYAHYNSLKNDDDENKARCYQIVAKVLKEDSSSSYLEKDAAKLWCENPCSRDGLVRLVDQEGKTFKNLEDAYDSVKETCAPFGKYQDAYEKVRVFLY